MKDIEPLLAELRAGRVVLCYTRDGAGLAWPARIAPDLRRQVRNRRRGLAQRMRSGDWRLCPAPDLHRPGWKYAGQGAYCCEICRRIDASRQEA